MPRRFQARIPEIVGALSFAAFVCAAGIPTLRHDWNWPIDRTAIPTFFEASVGGWVPTGFGQFNAHPTTYIIALPLTLSMWLFGPLAALVLFAAAIGLLCAVGANRLAIRWGNSALATIAAIAFLLFNPWVYNEIVAGHLVMVLAYGATIGLFAEMSLGRAASQLRCALWLSIAQTQLQFLIVALVAAILFAAMTRKWLLPIAGFALALPSVIGVVAEGSTLAKTPYTLAWQSNQSVAPAALSALGGYFPGYADRLSILASIAVWVFLALSIVGIAAHRRSRAIVFAAAAAVLVFLIVTGVNGPLGAAYTWTVENIPASGVFRELYDLAGILAVLVAFCACAATTVLVPLRYVAVAAAAILPVLWLLHPPGRFWVRSDSYPHPQIAAAPFERVALLPAFQPLQLRGDGGDGADPDAHTYPSAVTVVNEYLPSYPVDMALANYEELGATGALRGLGVSEVLARPWLVSRSNGAIGLVGASLARARRGAASEVIRYVSDPAGLFSRCERTQTVALGNVPGACAVFFGDASPSRFDVMPLEPARGAIDPKTDWIDARFAFAALPQLAQGIGGVFTVSTRLYRLRPDRATLIFVRGTLFDAGNNAVLDRANGRFRWIARSPESVRCAGICELVAQAQRVPLVPLNARPSPVAPLEFRSVTPWFYFVEPPNSRQGLLRFNARYDRGWIAVAGGRILPHLRIDLATNGWQLADAPQSSGIVLIHATSVAQLLAELVGIALALWLLKAAAREPTKRGVQ